MRETAQASIRSLPLNTGSAHDTIYGQDGAMSETNGSILASAAPKGSGLRHSLADDGSSEFDGPILQPTRMNGHF